MSWFLLPFLAACSPVGAPGPADAPTVEFVVPKGATARALGPSLAEAGLVHGDWAWALFLRTADDTRCVKAGKHAVSPSMTAEALLAELCKLPLPDDAAVKVLEGWRIRDIDAAIATLGLAPEGAYVAATRTAQGYTVAFPLPSSGVDGAPPTLEGYLYPDTYLVPSDAFDVRALVQRQLDRFAEQFWTAGATTLGARSLHDVVIMASMLEREEPSPANRPLVAGILWKRADKGWALGVDATSRYTLPDWNDRDSFVRKLRDEADPWNTRKRPGLPPTPIGNPSVDALRAAASPQPSDYWFYLHDAERTLHPSRSDREHEALRRKYDVR